MLRFQEEVVKRNLERLPQRSRVAFAASCAQRLADIFHRFLVESGKSDQTANCDAALAYVWSHILDSPDTEECDKLLANVMALIPDQDAPGWTPLTAYAEDALSAVAYCLTCLQSGDAQEAAWAARRVYEALDYFVTTRDDPAPDDPQDEAKVLGDPLIQAELERQARDIAELKHAGDSLSQGFLDILRKRSEREQALAIR